MPYPIPQFIEEESKIVFFLTFRQFFMLVGGGVICFVLFRILPFYYFIAAGIAVMLIIAILAFFKFNNESATKMLISFSKYILSPKNYLWRQQ